MTVHLKAWVRMHVDVSLGGSPLCSPALHPRVREEEGVRAEEEVECVVWSSAAQAVRPTWLLQMTAALCLTMTCRERSGPASASWDHQMGPWEDVKTGRRRHTGPSWRTAPLRNSTNDSSHKDLTPHPLPVNQTPPAPSSRQPLHLNDQTHPRTQGTTLPHPNSRVSAPQRGLGWWMCHWPRNTWASRQSAQRQLMDKHVMPSACCAPSGHRKLTLTRSRRLAWRPAGTHLLKSLPAHELHLPCLRCWPHLILAQIWAQRGRTVTSQHLAANLLLPLYTGCLPG